MNRNRSFAYRILFAFPVLFAAAGGLGSPAVAAPPRTAPTGPILVEAKVPEKPGFEILAPRKGAVLPVGKVLVVGRLPEGGGRVDLEVNGSSAGPAAIERNGFSGSVVLSPGPNTIVARSGRKETSITVTAGGTPDFALHPALEKCSGCHLASEKSLKISGAKDKLCYRCHQRKDKRKEVHGPMGAGECTACHDAHGSAHKALTVAEPLELCVLCHDQKSSEQHMQKSKGKPCVQCHDPHASDKPYHQK